MEAFERICTIRMIEEARDSDRAESIMREVLEQVAYEVISVEEVK